MMRIESWEQLEGVRAESGWLTVDQEMISAFARVTGDEQWIHVEPARAQAESPFGGTIAHGFLTLSLTPRLAFEAIELRLGQSAIINYGLNKVRFPAPVLCGARLRGAFTFLRREEKRIIWNVVIEAEGVSKPVCVAEWIWQIA